MKGVKFGSKHSYDDFGLILSSKEISPPKLQTKLIEVPMRDGSIDLTESLTGDVKYKDRTIKMTFSVNDPINQWTSKISAIENFLHGQSMQIVFDDDPAFFYIGRLAVNQFTSDKTVGTLVIEGIVDPFKYDLFSSVDDWEWNPFDFENGIINETAEIIVDGSETVVLIGRRKKTSPIITSSAAMTVTFKGATYTVPIGQHKMYDLILDEGENTLTFTGTGTISIDYRGGSL